MNLPLLQTILLGNPNLPTPTQSRKYYMDGRQIDPNNTRGAQVDPNSLASRIGKLIKGHKWWLVTELAEHLQTSASTVHSILARHQKKLNIDSNRFYNGKAMVKEYRIKPDGI